ncbi:hypothetical protein [Rhodoferax sp. GW822-FHT02A01]|uniref:hypothetical protein n=1 Tax=Rhodoferax sp. GW822-FHT02A01 TaxID=3141537 RepID=UPI00315DAC30
MHDVPLNQAIGLMGLGATQSPQLLAMVSHGDLRHEQPLLWQLGNALTQLGYGVTVLDGTVAETEQNPGLQQLLDFQFGHGVVESDAPEWNVLPAALGLQTLCALGMRPTHSLLRLAQTFQTNGVVVLYAGVDVLVKLLGHTDARPLLSVSSEKGSLMTTYLALKRLLRNGRIEPTILNMMDKDTDGRGDLGVAKALSECARNFLNYEVQALRIDPTQKESLLDMDMRRLATRLLENALPLRSQGSGNAGFDSSGYRELGRSH